MLFFSIHFPLLTGKICFCLFTYFFIRFLCTFRELLNFSIKTGHKIPQLTGRVYVQMDGYIYSENVYIQNGHNHCDLFLKFL